MKTIALTLISAIALSATAQANISTPSGLLLGIYATPSQGGMRVSSLIPGYSAQAVLQPGDVLLRATVDGFQMYNLRSHWEMEQAKMAIGANRQAAIEIYRPFVGMLYAFVEFTPLWAPSAAYSTNGAPVQKKFQAEFRIDNRARSLFQQPATNGGVGNGAIPQPPIRRPVPLPPVSGSNRDAARLFQR